MNTPSNKCERILYINECLKAGQMVNVEHLANTFHVSRRSVHRDIDALKTYYANRMCWGGEYGCITYDRINGTYRLDDA